MSATFHWVQSNGNPEVKTILGQSGNLFDFKTIDDTGIGDYAAHPIVAGNNSFEVWLTMRFDAPFALVSGIRFWMSQNFSPSTGLFVFFTGQQTLYLPPASGTSSIATSSMPTADPGSTNVSIGGNLSGSLTSSGNSDYVVLQLRTTVSAAAGDTSLATFTASYNES